MKQDMGKFSKLTSRKAIITQSLNHKNIEINAITYFYKSKSHTIMVFCVNILSQTQVYKQPNIGILCQYFSVFLRNRTNRQRSFLNIIKKFKGNIFFLYENCSMILVVFYLKIQIYQSIISIEQNLYKQLFLRFLLYIYKPLPLK